MYNEYVGLRENPFNVTPDARFFFSNPIYKEACASLLYGVQERRGFIVLTGEVGTGKTTLLRRLMDNFDEHIQYAFVYNTTFTFDELLEFICADFGIAASASSRLQRIVVRCRLERLKDRGIAPFIQHRLYLAGCKHPDVFSPEALDLVAIYSRGIPRIINVMCDNALLVAFGLEQETISEQVIEEVARDLDLAAAPKQVRRLRHTVPQQSETARQEEQGFHQIAEPSLDVSRERQSEPALPRTGSGHKMGRGVEAPSMGGPRNGTASTMHRWRSPGRYARLTHVAHEDGWAQCSYFLWLYCSAASLFLCTLRQRYETFSGRAP